MSQNVTVLSSSSTVLQALAKGVCPICTLVRAFQNELIEKVDLPGAVHLCNFHTWAIAATARAASAAYLFVALLQEHPETADALPECSACSLIRENEHARVLEFAKLMMRETFSSWIRNYGTVCRWHGSKLLETLPPEHAEIVRRVVSANEQELIEGLTAFAKEARHGGHKGGGVLGKAAEFLVAQRGITR